MRRPCEGQGRIADHSGCRRHTGPCGDTREGTEASGPRRIGTVGGQPSKGVAMKRFACLVLALGGLMVSANSARADWGSLHYGGYQPWWNVFAKRPCLSAEEERLRRFCIDYYDALQRYLC